MRSHVSILGVLDIPLVGVSVAAKHVLKAVPFEAETHRAIETVNRRPGTDRYAVFLVDNLVFLLVVELVDDDLRALVGQRAGPGGEVPSIALLHGVDERLGPKLRRGFPWVHRCGSAYSARTASRRCEGP